MNKKISILVFLFVMSSLLAAAQNNDTINQTGPNGLKQGYWEARYPNGSLRYKGIFKDGKPTGIFTRYFDNGEVFAIMQFIVDQQTTPTKIFYRNGKLAAEGNFVGEKKDGLWKYYSYYHETLAAEETYVLGQRQGTSRKYHKDGTIIEELDYQNHKKHGNWVQYFVDGSKKLVSHYQNDKRNGNFILYYPDGTMEAEGQYLDDFMHGEWKYYTDGGELDYQVDFEYGQPLNPEVLEEKSAAFFEMVEKNKDKIPEPDETNFLPSGQ